MGNMGYRNLCAILLCFGISLVSSQNVPSLDWQFDPYSTDQWFKQKLDHYDAGSIQFWPQRYVTSYRFYRLGGPVFIYLSGPGPELTLDDIESGAIAAYAEEQGAFVIGLEHRYYGKSKPTQDLSTEHLKYLTVPQTIEDLASFVRSWKTRAEFRNNKVVIFGASYLGSIAAWFAQKHPELLDAFVSSSAPLELRYEIPEFLQGIGISLNETDPKCYETIQEGFSCLEHVISEQGCENYTLGDIKTKFELCAELDTSNAVDVTGIFAELFSTISAVVMYHNPDPESFPDTNLGRFCRHITAENDKTALEKIGEKVKEINTHRGLSCSEFRFQTTVDFLDDKDWDSPAAKEGYRQLQFQLCNELGWTVASANISQPFGHFLSPFLHSEVCKKLFGFTETEMRLKVLQANNDLKGKALTTKCGIFVNGDHDPWHVFSISRQEEAGQCNRAILIKGGSHGRDVEEFTNTPSHPAEVRDAQLQISRYLDSWLKTGKCCDEASESRKVISTYSRSTRAPNSKEYYRFVNNIHQPNVQIKPHAYPFEEGEKLIASPTSIPYQVSTTDVLSVSPRIPIASQDQADGDMYRDPRNIELRRYRVVKLLRHRPSFAPPTYERMTPSMEQFEADFPEHRLRVEGRVERVFKNGTNINDSPQQSYTQIQSPRPDIESQQPLEQERKIMDQTDPVESLPQTPDSMNSGNEGGLENKNNRFRYVVKQIFRNVEDVEDAKEAEEKQVTDKQDGTSVGVKELEELESTKKNAEVSSSPKQTTKRQQSLEDIDIDELKKMGEKESTESSVSESGSHDKSSEIRKRESSEESGSKSYSSEESSSVSGSESDENSSATTKPIPLKKNKYSDESSGEDILVKVTTKTKPNKYSEEESDEGDSEHDDNEDDYDDYYHDDDNEDEDDDESNETHNSSPRRSRTNSNKTNSATDLSSGEGGRPRRLREKISEKIMSSSEEFDGAQKSKEKTNSKNSKNGRQTKQKADDRSSSDDDSLEDLDSSSSSSSSSEEYDDDDDNYSLEPSGSNTQKVYRKKQLTPIAKAAIEEAATVINVEISGSYPRRSRKRTSKKAAKLASVSDEQVTGKGVEKETKQPRKEHPRRRVHRRRRPSKVKPVVNETANSNEASSTAPTTSSTISTTTFPTTTANEMPGSNNYAAWNKLHKQQVIESEAKPLQEEPPRIVSLDAGSSEFPGLQPPPQNDNEGVTYIIIGDIPDENGNSIGDNPTNEALFNFIQKLVSRHSSAGIFAHHRPNTLPASIPQPPPPPPPPPTTTTTEAPPQSPFQNGFQHAGKYLLVRPVQVVPLGREQVVHSHDLRNDSFVDLITMETPPNNPHPYQDLNPQKAYPYQAQSIKRQNNNQYGGYRFKSPFHREHFEKLLSVDEQVRDSDRDDDVRDAYYQHQPPTVRRLDEIPDPSWRSIRGISQFGPVVPPHKATSGLLSLSAADTQWVNDGIPFIPRNRQFRNSHRTSGFN